jgi:acyl carrier protein
MLNESSLVEERVSEIVRRVGSISDLALDEDYYDAGLTSLGSLNLLLELEDAFGVSISDEKFIACRNVRALTTTIEDLKR